MALVHRVEWEPDFVRRSPWLWPIAPAARALSDCTRWPTLAELDRMYRDVAGARGAAALRFAPDPRSLRGGKRPRAPRDRYDGRIALRGEVPTRPGNWHDLLNALCFATWPRAKRALHERQYRALAGRPAGGHARSAEQDTLTLFDEGGVIVATHRESDARRVVVFGHALLEHLIEGLPCPGASARVFTLPGWPSEDAALVEALDEALARELQRSDRFLSPREAQHLRLV